MKGWETFSDIYYNQVQHYQGQIQDFLKGGSESGVDIEGGANRSIVSLKQGGLGGAAPQKLWGI